MVATVAHHEMRVSVGEYRRNLRHDRKFAAVVLNDVHCPALPLCARPPAILRGFLLDFISTLYTTLWLLYELARTVQSSDWRVCLERFYSPLTSGSLFARSFSSGSQQLYALPVSSIYTLILRHGNARVGRCSTLEGARDSISQVWGSEFFVIPRCSGI